MRSGMDLDLLNYADLQQLAKRVGLKANMKAVKLLRAVKQHFEQEVFEIAPSTRQRPASSPTPGPPSPQQTQSAKQSAKCPALKSALFKPTSSTKKIVRFSLGTLDNEHKRSLLKSPAWMSAALPLTPISGRKSDVHTNPVNRTPGTGINPFIFSGSDTPGTNKKKTFDLKASLSRPLAYKPHKGKLKPFPTQTTAPEKTQMVHQNNYKQHQVQTREERHVEQTEERKQKKEEMLGARRRLFFVTIVL